MGNTVQVDGFNSPQACELAGITYRQLDYWARTGMLRPSVVDAKGSGSQRLYSLADVRAAWVLGRLNAVGGHSIQHIRRTDLVATLLALGNGPWVGWLILRPDGTCLHSLDPLADLALHGPVGWLVNLSAVPDHVEEVPDDGLRDLSQPVPAG